MSVGIRMITKMISGHQEATLQISIIGWYGDIMRYLTLFIAALLLVLGCTGEIESLWIVEWEIGVSDSTLYGNLQHSFHVSVPTRVSFYESRIESDGKLYDRFYISEYNQPQVVEMKPSVSFELRSDTTVLLDTTFTWQDMAFDGNISRKTLLLP
jgi:hypothetical protein